MKVFTLFPNIYIRFAKNGLLIYDTDRDVKLVLSVAQSYKVDKLKENFIILDNSNQSIINALIENQFGYVVDCEKTPAIFSTLNFTSSKSKLRNATTNLDGGNSLTFVNKISLYIDPIIEKLDSPSIIKILDFPESIIADCELNQYTVFLSSVLFPNLQEIEIVSALTDRAINFAEDLKSKGYFVTFRTLVVNEDQIYTLINAINSSSLYYKIYANISLYFHFDKIALNNVNLRFWSTDINVIQDHKNVPIIPVIYDPKIQKELYNQVLLSIEDINAIKRSLYDLRYNSLFNASFMSSLKIVADKVLIGNQTICNINNFKDEFSKALFCNHNPWFLSRNKKPVCCDCIFADLCPSISYLELLGIIPRPCKLNFGQIN